MKRFILIALLILTFTLAACGGDTTDPSDVTTITLMLDWVPNTNHTGLFVAQSEGYFDEVGLKVEIIQPGEVFAEQAVASGAADFGISFQEYVTLSRAGDIPIVSIGAIIQHNSSGFASLSEQGIGSPTEMAGLTYGSFSSPFEEPTLRVLIEDCDGGDFSQLEIVDTGYADSLALLDEAQIDIAWIFYGWQGIQAEQQGIDLDVLMLEDYADCIPDYYTPVIIASESTIVERPDVVLAFMGAVSRGYEYAIANPDKAATILLEAVPELDEDLVRASQAWLSPRYQDDAPRWGEQSADVWKEYAAWMAEHGIIEEMIDSDTAFTNDFLP